MSTNFRQAVVDLCTEINGSRIAKQNIGNAVATVTALTLGVKAVRNYGLVGSLNPLNYGDLAKRNKVATALYLGGLGYSLYQQSRRLAEISRVETTIQATDEYIRKLEDVLGDEALSERIADVLTKVRYAKVPDVEVAKAELAAMTKDELSTVLTHLTAEIDETKTAEEAATGSDRTELQERLDELGQYLALVDEQITFRRTKLKAIREKVSDARKQTRRDADFDRRMRASLGQEQPLSVISPLWYQKEDFEAARSEAMVNHPAGKGLLTEDEVEDAKEREYAVNGIKRIFGMVESGVRCELVLVDRYENGTAFGVHLVIHPMGVHTANQADTDFGNYTIGLHTPQGAKAAIEYFETVMVNEPVLTRVLGYRTLPEEVTHFIYEQVIPLEWKSYDDDKLATLIQVIRGRVPSREV